MATHISHLADVHPHAKIGDNVEIGPFCSIGPEVTIGDGCRFDNSVVITGHTIIGEENRFFPFVVIGGEPQDYSFNADAKTSTVIGNGNTFREGVTVSRGAVKEDNTTRIGNHNLFMANSHIAHNCCIGDRVQLVNGVLLGGHVHVHDRAIVSGNTVVHHFSSIGTMAFISGGCRVPHDIPPFMLAAGNDDPKVITINVIGLQRNGVSEATIKLIKKAHRLIYREHKTVEFVKETLSELVDGVIPIELHTLFSFMEQTKLGKQGRARERFRNAPPQDSQTHGSPEKKVAA